MRTSERPSERATERRPGRIAARWGGLLIAFALVAAFIPVAEFTMDPGGSGEWASLGFIIVAGFWSVCGAVLGAIIGFARALRAKRAAATPRIRPLFLWAIAVGATFSLAMGGYGALRWEVYRRSVPEYVTVALVFAAGAGAVLGGAAWLVLRLTPRQS
jgi:hypothetical protein